MSGMELNVRRQGLEDKIRQTAESLDDIQVLDSSDKTTKKSGRVTASTNDLKRNKTTSSSRKSESICGKLLFCCCGFRKSSDELSDSKEDAIDTDLPNEQNTPMDNCIENRQQDDSPEECLPMETVFHLIGPGYKFRDNPMPSTSTN